MLMTHPHFSIAIVDSNMLAAIGMQQILADIMPIAEVRVFASFEQLETLKDLLFWKQLDNLKENLSRAITCISTAHLCHILNRLAKLKPNLLNTVSRN